MNYSLLSAKDMDLVVTRTRVCGYNIVVLSIDLEPRHPMLYAHVLTKNYTCFLLAMPAKKRKRCCEYKRQDTLELLVSSHLPFHWQSNIRCSYLVGVSFAFHPRLHPRIPIDQLHCGTLAITIECKHSQRIYNMARKMICKTFWPRMHSIPAVS